MLTSLVQPSFELPGTLSDGFQISGKLTTPSQGGTYRLSDLDLRAGTNNIAGWLELAPFEAPP
jgi:hypothetical protein